MENSVGSTIEKIKLQEQDKEAKLKEKREHDAVVASFTKAIREATSASEKSEQEQQILSDKINIMRTQLMLEKVRRDALIRQHNKLKKELEDLRSKSNEGISNVWKQRSNFCNDVHSSSDKYDVWALLMKPAISKPFVQSIKKEQDVNLVLENENRLQAAIEKRNTCLKERDRLKTEPDNGEEFIRIKNALRYSLEKMDGLRK